MIKKRNIMNSNDCSDSNNGMSVKGWLPVTDMRDGKKYVNVREEMQRPTLLNSTHDNDVNAGGIGWIMKIERYDENLKHIV